MTPYFQKIQQFSEVPLTMRHASLRMARFFQEWARPSPYFSDRTPGTYQKM